MLFDDYLSDIITVIWLNQLKSSHLSFMMVGSFNNVWFDVNYVPFVIKMSFLVGFYLDYVMFIVLLMFFFFLLEIMSFFGLFGEIIFFLEAIWGIVYHLCDVKL